MTNPGPSNSSFPNYQNVLGLVGASGVPLTVVNQLSDASGLTQAQVISALQGSATIPTLTPNLVSAAIANSASINSILASGDTIGGADVLINTPGIVYLANTLVWGKSRLIIGHSTVLKMGPATWPVPMFRNSAYVNRLSNFIVISSMTFSQSTGLVTVTCATNHNKNILDEIATWGANQNGYNGIYPVYSVVSPTVFTFVPDEVPTVLTATASAFLLDTSGTPQMRLFTPDIGGGIECYGSVDFDGLYLAANGDPGNPGGLNGPNAATPPSGNSTDYDILSLLFTKDWKINFYGPMLHSREHSVWICHSKNVRIGTINIGSAGADGVHFTGPIQDVEIGSISGHSLDNLYAIGTSDYIQFNFSEGAVKGIRCRKAYPDDCALDAVRLIGESQYPIDGWIGDIGGSVQATGALFNSFFDSLMVQGGNLWVRNFVVENFSGSTENTSIAESTAFLTDYLYIGPFTMGVQNKQGLLLGGPTGATAKHIIVAGSQSLNDQINSAYGMPVLQNSSTLTIDTLEINDMAYKRSTNAGTAGSGICFEQLAGNVKHLVFNEANFDGGVALFRLQNTINSQIDINNIFATTPTQIGIQGSSANATITVSLNGGQINMAAGTMFAAQASGTTTFDIRGGGCSVPGTFTNAVAVVSRTGTQTTLLHNWDLFVDARTAVNTGITGGRGQYCSSNTGGVNDTRYGACVSNGTNFYALATGASGVNTIVT